MNIKLIPANGSRLRVPFKKPGDLRLVFTARQLAADLDVAPDGRIFVNQKSLSKFAAAMGFNEHITQKLQFGRLSHRGRKQHSFVWLAAKWTIFVDQKVRRDHVELGIKSK